MTAHASIIRRGFTLVEAIASMVVVAALAGMGAQLTLRASRDYIESARAAELHTALASAFERLDRELREIRLRPNAPAVAPDIDALSASSITWNKAAGPCALTLSGSTLLLADAGGNPAPLLENVSALSLAAFDASGSPLALPIAGSACDAVRRIELSITVARDGRSDSLRTRVFLRSTMAGAGS